MPAKLTTRIVWLSKEELEKAKKKARKHRNFSDFIREAVRRFQPAK